MTYLDRLVWCDTETMGLDPIGCPIVEIGFQITDLDLNPIDDFQTTIWSSPYSDTKLVILLAQDEYVYDMHVTSGLWEEAQSAGISQKTALDRAIDFLERHGISTDDPLCGSSVQFDRLMLAAQYPSIEALFSYRNIDTSTVKELCRRYNPRVYDGLEASTDLKKLHRVLPDLEDTINEFAFYRDNFLFI